jgi:hypothetical protein
MGTGVRGFVEVDNTVLKVLLERSLQWSIASWNGRIMRRENIHLMIVFEEKRPLLGLNFGSLL